MKFIFLLIFNCFLVFGITHGQIIEFELAGKIKTDININFDGLNPHKNHSNDKALNIVLWNYETSSYINFINDSLDFIRFQNGRGEFELQVSDFFIFNKNHLLIYDPSLAKLLIHNVTTKKSKEFDIEESFQRIILSNTNNSADQISFYLFSPVSGALTNYSYSITNSNLKKIENYQINIDLKYFDQNPFNLINEIHIINVDTLVLVNTYNPFYLIYNLKSNKYEKYIIYEYTNSSLKKDGNLIQSPDVLLKSSTVDSTYLYCVYYDNVHNNKKDDTIIRINLTNNKIQEINYIERIECFIRGTVNNPEFITIKNNIHKITKSIDL